MKKIILIVMLICMSTQFLYADNIVKRPWVDGDLSIEEGAKPNPPYMKKSSEILKKYKGDMLRYEPDGKHNVIYVKPFKQEKRYYCGPATVKQVVHYICGSSRSQDYYADEMGTDRDGTDMNVMNNKLNKYVRSEGEYYEYTKIESMSDWIKMIMIGIDEKRPSILDINTRGIDAFPYESRGHFVNTSGYDFKYRNQIRITDPNGPGFGNVWYDERDLYRANINHFRRAILW